MHEFVCTIVLLSELKVTAREKYIVKGEDKQTPTYVLIDSRTSMNHTAY